MTQQQVYSQIFGNSTALKELYGAWTTFFYPYQDSTGLYGQEVYTDPNGNIYKYGEGPLNGYTGGNVASAAGVTQSPSASSAASSTTPSVSASNPLTSNAYVQDAQNFLTGSLIGGIPNWMLIAGVVAVFYLFGEEEHHGRKEEY